MRALLWVVVALSMAIVTPVASAQAEGPVFVDGQAQPVFDPKEDVHEKLWVRAPVDSDRDGKDDEVFAEVFRPGATQRGLKVPVVYFNSPYIGGGKEVTFHDVDVELHVPGEPGAVRSKSDMRTLAFADWYTSRGFAVVLARSLGTAQSTGCPTAGGRNETIGAKSVIDWLNGRATARDEAGAPVRAPWTTGKVGMIGMSYDGTLANAVATTGVRGLETIVSISAISSWYDYYRAGGAVVAPGMFQGEDADVLAAAVYTRADEEICRQVIAELTRDQDRVTGDYSRFWDERNYLNDVGKIRASVLAVHGLNDWNVKMTQVEQWYKALRRNGVEHKIWLHQQGHNLPGDVQPDLWDRLKNRWFSHYLWGVDNGIERGPKATVQREDETWVDEAEWPAPGTSPVSLRLTPGGLGLRSGNGVEKLTDDSSKTAEFLIDQPASPNRLSYSTTAARQDLRLSGVATVGLQLAFDRPAANVTALLVDRAPDGKSQVITRGWADPQNRTSLSRTKPITPGESYRVKVRLEPDDHVLKPGHRLEFVLISSDYDHTLRPKPGAGLSLDLARSTVELPVVGGWAAALRSF